MYGWLCIYIEKAWASVFPYHNRNHLIGNNTSMKDGVSVPLWRWQLWNITTTCKCVFLHTSPQNKAGMKFPFLFFSFLLKKVFLLYIVCCICYILYLCLQNDKQEKGVSAPNEILTHSDCGCWECGAHPKSVSFWPELLSLLDVIFRAVRHRAPASCAGSTRPVLLTRWQACHETQLPPRPAEEAHVPRRLEFRAMYLLASFLSSRSPVRDRCVVSNYSLIGIGRYINIIGTFVLINRGNLPHTTQHEKRDHQQEEKTGNHCPSYTSEPQPEPSCLRTFPAAAWNKAAHAETETCKAGPGFCAD